MKASTSFTPRDEPFLDNATQAGEKLPHGHLESANFPSTAEVFQAVFENKLFANCIGNSRDETLEANKMICRIFGYSEEEMIRLSTKEIFDVEEDNYIKYLEERASCGRAKAVITGIRKNGERFPCKISSVIFTGDNGEARTINTMYDISRKFSNKSI